MGIKLDNPAEITLLMATLLGTPELNVTPGNENSFRVKDSITVVRPALPCARVPCPVRASPASSGAG